MKKIGYLIYIIFILFACSKSDPIAPTPTPPPILEIGELNLELRENNKNCETGTINSGKADVELKWKAAKNASKYEIQITDLSDGKITSVSDIVGNSKIVSLLRDKSYAWNITASHTGSKSIISASWKFYVPGDGKTNQAPSAAKAIYPVPGSTIFLNTTGDVAFEWTSEDPDKDVLSYTLRIDTVTTRLPLASNSFDVKSPKKEVKLTVGKIYYWSVISKDAASTVTSDVFSFRLK